MRSKDTFYTAETYREAEPVKKNRGFGIFVFILLLILIAAIVCLALLIRRDGALIVQDLFPKNFSTEYRSDSENPKDMLPAASLTPIPNPNPTSTPMPEDREIPQFDGEAPLLYPGTDTNTIPDIFEAVAPSVVSVRNYVMLPFAGKQRLELFGSGTGFVVSSEGYILTNAHVVEDAQRVTVQLPNGEELEATIIGADEDTDVAVLKVTYPNLRALALGDSDAVRVGEFVLAIGNPLDDELLTNTLTYGIVSAIGREVNIDGHTNSYLQTDAAINYGNSGGPLLNLKGEVVGMNSAKTITAGYDAYGNPISAEGIGYALPINTVMEIMEQLIAHGAIERPAVGITVYTLTEAMAEELGVPQGVCVESVVKGGPASRAGLRSGDVILSANGREISEQNELIAIINECSIGDIIELRFFRNGEEFDCTIELSNKAAMDFNDVDVPVDEN